MTRPILDDLNPAQRDAVLTTAGPLLVLAGAGSGKTRVLTHRIAHLVADQGVLPAEILAITFTNKAAAEMRARLERILGHSARGMWVMTFHAMCVRMLRADGELVGFGRSFSIYDDDDKKRAVSGVLADLGVDTKRFPPQMVSAFISAAKNELVRPAAYESCASTPVEKVVARAFPAYQARLKMANAMDFDDLLVHAHALLAENPPVLCAYRDRFRYVHVDEYQDTNHAQYAITNLLVARDRNLMVVGDDDQSIYSWRGADIRNILEFERDYPEAKVIRLEQNYRSTQTILTAANYVVAKNSGRKPKTLWTANAAGEAITRFFAADERDEARFVATEIERLVADEDRRYSDFAVFYRTNAQSRIVEDQLLRAGVPYQIVGGTRFFERAEIRDVVAYMRAIVNPSDDQSLKRIINVPRRGIGDVTVGRLEVEARSAGITLAEALRRAPQVEGLGPGPVARVTELVELFGELRGLGGATLRETVEELVAKTGLIAALEAQNTPEAHSRADNIREFFGVVEEYDAQHEEGSLGDFIEWAALRTDLDSYSDEESVVTLMTLHTAKGLEFPVVFIVGMEDSIFPHANSMFQPHQLEEERRLCYVGITRARERLYLSHAYSRSLYGKVQHNLPSRFVEDVPAECLRVSGVGSAGAVPRRAPAVVSGADVPAREGRVFGSGRAVREPSAPKESCEVGDMVEHKTFGRGTVTAVEGDKVTVSFAALGTKNLLLGYAPLRKVKDG